MRTFLLPLAAAITLVHSEAVQSASADYCRPYARDLTQVLINYIWERAYNTCMNVEGADPKVPDNWRSAWIVIDPTSNPTEVTAATKIHIAALPKPLKPPPPVKVDPDPLGLTPPAPIPDPPAKPSSATPDKAQCIKYWPRTYRASDNTIIRGDSKQRTRIKCPY
jgi:hypothetical protein